MGVGERGQRLRDGAPGGGSSDPSLQPWHQPCGFLSGPERAWGSQAGSVDGREAGPALGRGRAARRAEAPAHQALIKTH